MNLRTPLRYGSVAIGLHWVIAALIITLLIMGLVMEGLPLMTKFKVYQWHKSLGVTVLFLVCLRVMWRFTHPAPMLPVGTPRWQAALAHTTHGLMYALMVLMPVTGWLFSDASGYHPNWFGLPLPMLANVDREWATTVKELHVLGGNALWVLLAMHMGAALQHHLLLRDDTLTRMVPQFIKVPRPNVARFLPARLRNLLIHMK